MDESKKDDNKFSETQTFKSGNKIIECHKDPKNPEILVCKEKK